MVMIKDLKKKEENVAESGQLTLKKQTSNTEK